VVDSACSCGADSNDDLELHRLRRTPHQDPLQISSAHCRVLMPSSGSHLRLLLLFGADLTARSPLKYQSSTHNVSSFRLVSSVIPNNFMNHRQFLCYFARQYHFLQAHYFASPRHARTSGLGEQAASSLEASFYSKTQQMVLHGRPRPAFFLD
jgi:hypothetical protein